LAQHIHAVVDTWYSNCVAGMAWAQVSANNKTNFNISTSPQFFQDFSILIINNPGILQADAIR